MTCSYEKQSNISRAVRLRQTGWDHKGGSIVLNGDMKSSARVRAKKCLHFSSLSADWLPGSEGRGTAGNGQANEANQQEYRRASGAHWQQESGKELREIHVRDYGSECPERRCYVQATPMGRW